MSALDLLLFIQAVCGVCLAAAAVGCAFTLLQAFLIARFSGEAVIESADEPAVTVLKPLHEDEPDLLLRLGRFCEQDYAGPVQIVCGVRGDATAAAVMQEFKAKFPDKTIECVTDARGHGSNGKVSNLVNMLPSARHGTLVLSDSDIVVEADYLREVTALLEAPRVGAVTCLYYGTGEGLWQRLSALTINSHFLPQAILATSLGLAQYCCGATVAMRRSMLDRIGGFAAFGDELADDFAIGNAIRSLGLRIVTAPRLVGHRCREGSFGELMQHQLRATRTIKSIDPVGYIGTIIAHPWALALLGMLSGSVIAAPIAVVALASRLLLCLAVARRFGLPRRDLWLVPLHDMVAFAVYFMSFCGKTVHWQGSDYRVTEEGMLIELEAD